MEGGSFSTSGSRIRATHIRFKDSQELHGLRAGRFQNVAVAFAPRTFLLQHCKSLRVPMIDVPEM
eukprot:6682355-Pyramimonas_sp.AAC.1